jgi:hypothetical protein
MNKEKFQTAIPEEEPEGKSPFITLVFQKYSVKLLHWHPLTNNCSYTIVLMHLKIKKHH